MAMGLTLRQAAETCGRGRSTIHRALKNGKLSGSRDESGTWNIDPSELARVFPWDTPAHDHRDDTGRERERNDQSAEVLAMKVEMLEQQLEREKETVEDLRTRLDKAEERVFALSAPPPQPDRHQQSLWRRIGAFWASK